MWAAATGDSGRWTNMKNFESRRRSCRENENANDSQKKKGFQFDFAQDDFPLEFSSFSFKKSKKKCFSLTKKQMKRKKISEK